MAIDKPLTAFFGNGATQTATGVTFVKADLISTRNPVAFTPLAPIAVNTSESIFTALFLRIWENQDTSQDSQLAIFGPEVSLVEVVSDGIARPFEQYIFQVRILVRKGQSMPNPNLV
ncbi:hypothetical protein [Microcoleus sp. bin38.metabat.b11b12b14.051]|uniref:hypothetical protein n=1 Tax=Microcoleus sp. bin38.metabat.b11b12b14.051 TaxID=2742709 RepID=UPI0025F68ACF|nr:hypothetical protein [Microcoleus sp. bin38.metabat.b11b12b14.051]